MKTWATALEISAHLLDEVEAHARQTYPQECCGILVGTPGHDTSAEVTRVTAVWPTENAETGDRTRGFVIATEVLLHAHKRARDLGDEVIGYYHSHPGKSAAPSPRDIATAAPGASYLIVAIGSRHVLESRSWRWRPDLSCFDEEQLV